MSEYDQLCNILDKGFQASNQKLMIESKGTTYKPQKVEIDGTGRTNLTWTLYRFDLEKKEFLQFFNMTNEAPEGLRKFCDYVLLVEASGKSYVLLIEMKRGSLGDAEKQLNASECFINYLYSSAERLHRDFDGSEFNRRSVVLRKIKLRERKSNKLTTKVGTHVDKTQEFITYESVGQFPIARFIY